MSDFVTARCVICGVEFQYQKPRRGRRRHTCSAQCRRTKWNAYMRDYARTSRRGHTLDLFSDLNHGADMTENTDTSQQAACDVIVTRAAAMMLETGAPLELVIDRFVTYITAQTVASFGAEKAIGLLNLAALSVEQGRFKGIEDKYGGALNSD